MQGGERALQDGLCFALAALYGVGALYVLSLVARLLCGSGRTRAWTKQKTLHVLVAVVMAVRCAFFACVPAWEGVYFYVRLTASAGGGATALYVLEEAPTLLLLGLYTQQLLLWAHSYHTTTASEGAYARVVVPVVLAANGAVWAAQVAIWVAYDRTRGSVDPDVWSLSAAGVHAGAFFAAAVALGTYGALVGASVGRTPLGLALRLRQQRVVRAVSGVCTAAFLLRSVFMLGASWAAYDDFLSFDDDFTGAGVALTLAFFVLTELAPLSTVLWYHRPRTRASGRVGGSPSASASLAGAMHSLRVALSPTARKGAVVLGEREEEEAEEGHGGGSSSSGGGSPSGSGGWRLLLWSALPLRQPRAGGSTGRGLLHVTKGGEERTRLLQLAVEGGGGYGSTGASSDGGGGGDALDSARAAAAAAADAHRGGARSPPLL